MQLVAVGACDLNYSMEGPEIGEVCSLKCRYFVGNPHPVSEQVDTGLSIERWTHYIHVRQSAIHVNRVPIAFGKGLATRSKRFDLTVGDQLKNEFRCALTLTRSAS